MTTPTPGVAANPDNVPANGQVTDTTNGVPYINHGTPAQPVWVKVSAT